MLRDAAVGDSTLIVQIYEEACEWLVSLRTSTADALSRERFDAWLRKSPEHVRAYLEVAEIWEHTGLHDRNRSIDVRRLIARAAQEDNVVPLGTTTGSGLKSAEFAAASSRGAPGSETGQENRTGAWWPRVALPA